MTSATALDRRRQLVQEQSVVNGIDHVEVVPAPSGAAPTQLRVVFVNSLVSVPDPIELRVFGGERIPTVAVTRVEPTVDPATALVTLAESGDLSTYTLQLVKGPTDPDTPDWVDPILSCACFVFALECADGLPCDHEPVCPPAAVVEPRISYLARDWESLRAVLLDRMAVLQPNWTERNAADVRTALVEVLAELGDRASYRQDAIATEAYLGTARRRISVRRHARLVDYTMSDGTSARAWVQIVVPDGVELTSGGVVPVVPTGTRLLTGGPDAASMIAAGSPGELAARRAGALEFHTMHDLDAVVGAHAAMRFYTWSGSRPVLAAGATAATLVGHLPLLAQGQILILTEHRDPIGPQHAVADADPTRRQPVRLTTVVAFDGGIPLTDALTGDPITEITWHDGDGLPFPLTIAGEVETTGGGAAVFDDGALALGNIVLVGHGKRELPEELGLVPATGPVTFRLAHRPLSQVARTVISVALPGGSGTEQRVEPFDPSAAAAAAIPAAPALVLPDVSVLDDQGRNWTVHRDLISSSGHRDVVVEVDDDGFGRLRFGRADDGLAVNGEPPQPGDAFHAAYRTGNGAVGNVGIGAIRSILDDGSIAASLRDVLADSSQPCSVANPVPGQGGTDPETIEQVRQRAPFAFRIQERAVTPDDYARRAEQFGLPGRARVQRAVATIAWTGSWYAVVVAVDPAGHETVDDAFLAELTDYLDAYRMAGHDLDVVAADYVPIEVGLVVEVDPAHRRDLVRAELLAIMSNQRSPDGRLGLFHPDRLTFGVSVYLGPIVAAAQDITGVERVEVTRFWRFRLPGTDARTSGRIEIGPHEIARLDNDPNQPERGRFFLDDMRGGR